LETAGKELQEYRVLRKTVKPGQPLWPYRDDDPELLKLREEEEKRRKEEEAARKAEEERRQAELLAEQQKAAAAASKGGKGAPPAKAPPPQPVASRAQLTSGQGVRDDAAEVTTPSHKGEPIKMSGSKDEEEKEWNFQEMDAVLTEIASKNAGIGGILAAMVYQIDHNGKKKDSSKGNDTSKMKVGGGLIKIDDSSNPQGG
jgi:hypothetical protein